MSHRNVDNHGQPRGTPYVAQHGAEVIDGDLSHHRMDLCATPSGSDCAAYRAPEPGASNRRKSIPQIRPLFRQERLTAVTAPVTSCVFTLAKHSYQAVEVAVTGAGRGNRSAGTNRRTNRSIPETLEAWSRDGLSGKTEEEHAGKVAVGEVGMGDGTLSDVTAAA